MSDLVTVVTSTWQRPQTLMSAVRSVNAQTYPEVEHVVVIDGNDPVTVGVLDDAGYSYGLSRRRVVSLGRNWSLYSGDGGFGATCRLVGAWLGAGEYITYLDDDVEYDPGHIAAMVTCFEPGIDFVASQWHGGCASPPPGTGRTDTSGIMHRALALKKAGGFHPDGYEGDGHLVERFIAAGLQWRHKAEPSFRHPTGCHHGGNMP